MMHAMSKARYAAITITTSDGLVGTSRRQGRQETRTYSVPNQVQYQVSSRASLTIGCLQFQIASAVIVEAQPP